MSDKTWPEWEDALGNTFKPGDIVAVATVSGRSPQMVIARVERINRKNGSGELIMTNKWFDHEEPIERTRECYSLKTHYPSYYSRPPHVCKRECTVYLETGETRLVPSATVRAKPLERLRWGRFGDNADGTHKSVTYTIIENIILIERGEDK